MCIDFIDLSKGIPEKPYPLPQIDQLEDVVAGHKFFSFLDAYKGYHQIEMAEVYMPKTSLLEMMVLTVI